jgi:hypothetical protein
MENRKHYSYITQSTKKIIILSSKILLILSLLWLSCTIVFAASKGKDWLSFEPSIVELQGILIKVMKYGPPNYGEDPEIDAKLEVPILMLSQPIRVAGDPSSPINRESVTNVTEIQLIFGQGSESHYWRYLNSKVLITGTLFRRFTGNHFTDVVMIVKTIKEES